MRLTFLGATGTVTGSKYLLEHGGHRVGDGVRPDQQRLVEPGAAHDAVGEHGQDQTRERDDRAVFLGLHRITFACAAAHAWLVLWALSSPVVRFTRNGTPGSSPVFSMNRPRPGGGET